MYNDEACQVRKQVDWVFDSRSRPGHYPLVFGHTRRAAYRLLRQRRLEDPRWVHMLKLCNPKVMRKVGLEVELVKLDKLWAAHCQSQRELRITLSTLPRQIAWREREIAGYQAVLAQREAHPQPDDRFQMLLRASLAARQMEQHGRREAAGCRLRELAVLSGLYSGDPDEPLPVLFVLFVLSGAMMLLRLLPGMLRILHALSHHRADSSFYIALAQVSRRPRYFGGPLLLIALMTSLAVHTVAMARTLDANLRDRTYYAVGADVTLAERAPTQPSIASEGGSADAGDSTAAERGAVFPGGSMWALPYDARRHIAGVERAARVGRYGTNHKPDKNRGPADLLAIEPAGFAGVTFWRADFSHQNLGQLFCSCRRRHRMSSCPGGTCS